MWTEAASVETAFAATRADLGEVDALIYNAGSGVWGHVEEVKAEDLERSWRVNTLGLFLAAQQAIPAMRRKGQGADHRRRRDRLTAGCGRRRGIRSRPRWRSARSPNPWPAIFGLRESMSR